jgi:hypothetical protein
VWVNIVVLVTIDVGGGRDDRERNFRQEIAGGVGVVYTERASSEQK